MVSFTSLNIFPYLRWSNEMCPGFQNKIALEFRLGEPASFSQACIYTLWLPSLNIKTICLSSSRQRSTLPLLQVYLKVVSLVLHLARHVPRQTTIRGTTPKPRRRPNNVRPSPFSPNSGLGPSSCPPSEKNIQMAPVFPVTTHRIIHVLPITSHFKRHKTAPVPPTLYGTVLEVSCQLVSHAQLPKLSQYYSKP